MDAAYQALGWATHMNKRNMPITLHTGTLCVYGPSCTPGGKRYMPIALHTGTLCVYGPSCTPVGGVTGTSFDMAPETRFMVKE